MLKELATISTNLFLVSENWYKEMVGDCRAILVERVFNSRHELILAKGEIGERIYNDPNYNQEIQSNAKFTQQMAHDIRLSASETRRCIQFYVWVEHEYEKIKQIR